MSPTRSRISPFDEFDEFDNLLEDDEPTQVQPRARAAAGRVSSGMTGAQPAVKVSSTRGRLALSPDVNWSRIGAVAVLAFLVLFVLWFAISSFRHAHRNGGYRDYFSEVKEIASQSEAEGAELTSILNSADAGDRSQRIQSLEQLATRADKLEANARKLDAPDQLKDVNDWMLTSLDYRARGIASVQRSITTAMQAKADKEAAAEKVSDALARLVASDVVWSDSFAAMGRNVLSADDVTDVTVPDSTFLKDRDSVGPEAITQMLDRLRVAGKASASGAVVVPNDGKTRGGQLESGQITIAPSGKVLSATSLNEIKSGDEVEFDVPFTNQGEVQLTDVPVTITLRSDSSDPVELTGTIDAVDPGQTGTAKVSLSQTPDIGVPMTMDVLVGPIPGEKVTENNRASYNVQFSL
jgi:hypothetical protein